MPIITTTPQQALALLERLHKELQSRQKQLRQAADYYDGKHPLAYASPQFASYWGGLFESFSDNWCGVVVDSKTERLVVRGVRIGQKSADEETHRVWQTNGLDADSGLAFVDAIAQGRSFALVWGDPDDPDTPAVTFESAHEAVVAYEPGSRRRRVAALKCWVDHDEYTEHATLYLADSVWKFSHQSTVSRILERTPAKGAYAAGPVWTLRDLDEDNPQPNPMGLVPMVELPNRQRLGKEPCSEIETIIPLQNGVNVLWSHLITASDFAAFPQRVIMGMEVPTKPVIDPNTGKVIAKEPVDLQKFALDRILWLEDPEATIGHWVAADLENYSKVIETAVGHIAAQTRTPQHYLVGKMANLSAEALKAAETGLVSTVKEKQLYFGESIREVCRLIALCQGDEGKAEEMRTANVIWQDPESRSDAELADALGKLAVMLHVPDEILWRRFGFTDDEIAEMKRMQAEQQERELDLLTKTSEASTPDQPPQEPAAAAGSGGGGKPAAKTQQSAAGAQAQ